MSRIFAWWTGNRRAKSWGIHYGRHDWPSKSEWFVPGTWDVELDR